MRRPPLATPTNKKKATGTGTLDRYLIFRADPNRPPVLDQFDQDLLKSIETSILQPLIEERERYSLTKHVQITSSSNILCIDIANISDTSRTMATERRLERLQKSGSIALENIIDEPRSRRTRKIPNTVSYYESESD